MFAAKNPDFLQVVLYKKGNAYQIYEGSASTDLSEIARTVENNI